METRTDHSHRLTILETRVPHPPARVLVLRGTVDCGDEAELRAAFTRVLAADRLPLIVDLGALRYADESLLGLLLAARARLHLVGPLSHSLVHRLDITGTRDVFRVHTDLTDALARITATAAEGVDAPDDPGDRTDTRH
ncbi:STAS domain-containing protein [Streptomyces sp. NPDC001523]|uniref:STAS domain-containing protein n=1 Tax=Streptomyces sp. NPDC001523 TaxID=3154383 RepID=UPI003316C7BD